MLALVNGHVLTETGFTDNCAVLISGEHIVDVASRDDTRLRDAVIHDLGGATLAPGFIDAQVNGGGGVLFNDAPNLDGIRHIGTAHRRFGTTGFLPTLISDDAKVMQAAITAVHEAIATRLPGVLGIHLEGPFLAPARKGVHDSAKFRLPDATDVELIASLDNKGVTLLTLAPECVDVATIRTLTARGVILAAGHTAATYQETRQALEAGVRGFTHLYNAMSPLTSREPGAVGAALDDTASWCGLIVDGFHVHPAALRIALTAKSWGKCFLVTDAMPPVGAELDTFALGDTVIRYRDGRCLTTEGTLAGSALDMASAVRNTVAKLGVALDEALRMASTYPADFLGLGKSHGRIAAGYRADFVVLDTTLHVRETWIGGRR